MKATLKEKVEFLKKNCPDLESVNPYQDFAKVDEIRKLLHTSGFYKTAYAHGINYSTVVNIIMYAKTKNVTRQHAIKVRY